MNKICILVLLMAIIGSISGYCQTEYYYDYDKYMVVQYSDDFLAIKMDENYSDWAGFFDDNDFLVRKENLFQMPNNMYLMKLKVNADISSSLIQLSNNPAVDKIIRAWKYENTPFIFPLNKFVVFFKEKMAAQKAGVAHRSTVGLFR